jgi:DNA segregation ATPase FtsK/SpoIIIE-like protein
MNIKQLVIDKALKLMYGEFMSADELNVGKVAAKEVTVIHQRFEQLNVKAIIDVNGIVASDTGNFIRYPIHAYGKIASIESIEDDLSMAISMLRGVETEVHIRKPLLAIELPFPLATRPLLWSDANLNALKPGQALLGMNYSATQPQPAVIDYNRRTIAHTLTAGATGSGKSVLIIGKLVSLSHSTGPDENLIIFCDPKFDPDWKVLADLPHVVMVSEPVDCVAAIASVKAELERRKRCPDKRKLILVIDEYADFLGDLPKETLATVESHIRSITSVGRSLGIHVDLITQKPTVEIVDSIAKGNLTTRCGGMVMTSKESEIAMGAGGIGCETLPGQGSFYVTIGGGRVQRIQSYLIEGNELETAIDTVNQRWADVVPYRIVMQQPATSDQVYTPNDDERNAQRILAVYSVDQLFGANGKIKNGMQTAAVRVLFGEDAANEGGNHRAVTAALRWIKNSTSTDE